MLAHLTCAMLTRHRPTSDHPTTPLLGSPPSLSSLSDEHAHARSDSVHWTKIKSERAPKAIPVVFTGSGDTLKVMLTKSRKYPGIKVAKLPRVTPYDQERGDQAHRRAAFEECK
jgi:hypothetical protein